jgi:hypothetical protein
MQAMQEDMELEDEEAGPMVRTGLQLNCVGVVQSARLGSKPNQQCTFNTRLSSHSDEFPTALLEEDFHESTV